MFDVGRWMFDVGRWMFDVHSQCTSNPAANLSYFAYGR